MFILILVVFGVLGFAVQSRLKSKFKKYGNTPLSSGLSGAEVAEKMLQSNGIFDVKITSVRGKLSDHYNPQTKTVNLSEEVFHGRSVAAAAVAAHECGHAVQHKQSYQWLNFRSALVPAVQIASSLMNWIFIFFIFGGFILNLFPQDMVLLTIVIAQGALALFAVVTLPVEYDASNRALAWLRTAHITRPDEQEKAEDALKWAARTYLVAALAALTQLAYFLLRFVGNDD